MVTGASRGLGLQMVESLATGSFSPGKIIATARDPSRAQVNKPLKNVQSPSARSPELHDTLAQPLPTHQLYNLPYVVSQDSIEKAAKEVDTIVQGEGLNCLINNAGINVIADFETVTAEQMLENFHTNSVAPLMVTKALLPLLQRAATRGTGMGIHRAAVINITSLLGSIELYWGDRANTFKWYPYRTSKGPVWEPLQVDVAALNMLSRCMAVDLQDEGILCMALHPGWVRTDMGGPQAPLSTEESISSVLSVIGGLTEKDHGGFLHYTGEPLPWWIELGRNDAVPPTVPEIRVLGACMLQLAEFEQTGWSDKGSEETRCMLTMQRGLHSAESVCTVRRGLHSAESVCTVRRGLHSAESVCTVRRGLHSVESGCTVLRGLHSAESVCTVRRGLHSAESVCIVWTGPHPLEEAPSEKSQPSQSQATQTSFSRCRQREQCKGTAGWMFVYHSVLMQPTYRGGGGGLKTDTHEGGAVRQRDMNFPATLELSIGDIRMPFSDEVKYSILGISVFLFLVAIIILVWQLHGEGYVYLWSHVSQHRVGKLHLCGGDSINGTAPGALTQPTSAAYTLNSLLCSEDKCAVKGASSSDVQTPGFKVEQRDEECRRLSRCLSPMTVQSELGRAELDGPSDLEEAVEDQPQVQGSLQFSLFYDRPVGRLVVTVLGARGLPPRSFSHSVDPFVRVRLLWTRPEDEPGSAPLRCILQEWQTHTVKNSADPNFGDQFSCSLSENAVRDFDKYSRHGILGEVRAALGTMDISYPLEIEQDLQAPRKVRRSGLEEALFARTSVVCNRCKLRHQRTSLKTRWEVTVFNEVMTFTLPDTQVKECNIVVSVYEMGVGKRSSKHLIGQLSLGKGKRTEDEHWSLMTRSLRQPIAKWHMLFI
ncbi:hypothetical protein JZ751_008160 [Albula glossodonta]|uniref:C2 domain-containing protein n=1 Tax=Albula glossodonta TaxID=121402 RepID=A0A8T2N4T1_9TELE|nr:hypothetical protein JZ751_008160 [Albula glossodonta]